MVTMVVVSMVSIVVVSVVYTLPSTSCLSCRSCEIRIPPGRQYGGTCGCEWWLSMMVEWWWLNNGCAWYRSFWLPCAIITMDLVVGAMYVISDHLVAIYSYIYIAIFSYMYFIMKYIIYSIHHKLHRSYPHLIVFSVWNMGAGTRRWWWYYRCVYIRGYSWCIFLDLIGHTM